jgi:hypothetical protein
MECTAFKTILFEKKYGITCNIFRGKLLWIRIFNVL